MPKAVSTAKAGEPDMPMTGIPVLIGDKARMSIRVVDAQYRDFEGIEVAPSKGDFPRTINPEDVPYTYGACYSEDAFFPASNIGLYEPYIIRDFRGQNMVVYPFAYNPATKTLRVYYNMTVEMYKVDDHGENVIETRRSNVVKMDPDFKSVYQRHFINYEASMNRYTPIDEEGDLLIICYDNFIDYMTDFVNWKKTRGVNTTIVGTSTAGSSYSAIKTYIQNQYNANNNLTHVLLVGDVAQIPGYSYTGGGSSYGGKGDNAYGQIVGSDIYNDVFIGRFSASSAARVTTQANRVITYERDLTTSATWLQVAQGIARNEGGSGHNGEDDYEHMDVIRTDLLNYGYSPVYQRYENLSGYTATASQISSDINSGVGIINYCNHGAETMWGVANYSVSHVNALTNNNKLPFIWSVACLVGKYDYSSDCFAEAWMNATNNNNPTGAIGTLMSYISQPWIPPMWAQDECVDILVGLSNSGGTKHTWGGLSINGLLGIFDNYGSDQAAVGTYQAWILYGDPSMLVRTKTPQAMSVSHTGTITPGVSTYSVTVSNGSGAVATITDANHNILGRGTVNGTSVSIPISGTLTPGTELTLCVFGFNKQTYLGTISVVGGTQYTITATANPTNAGTVTGGGELYANTTCTLTAVPNSGFDFVNWNDGSTANPRSFTVTGPATFVANFAPLTLHNITLASVTNGTISADHATAYKNDVINLTATPASGYSLNSWVVYKTGDINTTVPVNGNSFTMPDYDVTVAATFVSSQSNEITIGSTAVNTTGWALPTHVYYGYSMTQQIYTAAEVGTAGTITAISFYYLGSSTSGSASSSGSRDFSIYMSNTTASSLTDNWVDETSDHLVYSGTSTFNSVGWYTFTLDTPFVYDGTSNLLLTFDDNTGSYSVSSRRYFRTYSTGGDMSRYIDSDTNDFDPSTATSLTSSSGSYNTTATENNIIKLAKTTAGANAALSVSPNNLSGFQSMGGVSPSESQSVAFIGANLQSNVNVTLPAGFEASTTATGTYANTLTLTPTNGELRTMVYVRLSANANPGSITGNMTFTCGNSTATVSLSGNVIAGSGTQYTITANASPAAGGTISGAGTYYEGLTCTLTATANAGYEFQNWSDGNTENPRSFTVTGNATYTAVFAEIPVYEINISEVTNGSISADKTSAMQGETVTLTANPNTGYTLEGWHVYETENVSNIVTVTGNSFTMPDFDVTVAATFVALPQYIKVTSAPSDWSGEYILVYEQSTTTGYIWTGVDNASCYVSKPISDGTIANDDFVTITISPMNSGYSVKVNGGTNNGKYIYGSSNSNVVNFGTSPVLNTFSYESNSVKMVSNNSVMRFNNASNNLRFRYFKSSSYSSQKAIQLYKKVNPGVITYTITFNANEGSGSMDPQEVNELEPTALIANAFTRENYDFVGWNTAADGSGDHYDDEAIVSLSSNLTLYAQWSLPLEVNYQLVTSANQLVAGKSYLIINVDAGKALGKTQNNNNRSAEDVVIDGDAIHTLDNTVCELTLGGSEGAWTFFDAGWGDNGGYLYAASSSKNYLRTQEVNDANGQWSIEIGSNGVATIQAQGENTRNLMRYNSTNDLFACYAAGQQDIYLFAEVETIELSPGINWWAPTTTMTLAQLKEALGGNAILINSQDGGFLRYENNTWSGTLTEIVPGQMYKIETTADVSLTMNGTPATGVSLSVLPGYNWFGYTGSQAKAITSALGNFTPANGDRIIAQDGTEATYNNGWSGDFTELVPGHGYIYFSTDNQTKMGTLQ